MHVPSFGKLVAVSKLKSLDDGIEEWVDPTRPKTITKLERVLGYMKFYYYTFEIEIGREPKNLIDFYDGLNAIYFRNNPKAK